MSFLDWFEGVRFCVARGLIISFSYCVCAALGVNGPEVES
jgi:hypothetical protein